VGSGEAVGSGAAVSSAGVFSGAEDAAADGSGVWSPDPIGTVEVSLGFADCAAHPCMKIRHSKMDIAMNFLADFRPVFLSLCESNFIALLPLMIFIFSAANDCH
jgi:hypothetical protein